jgi:chaperonin cofactor prefoldin
MDTDKTIKDLERRVDVLEQKLKTLLHEMQRLKIKIRDLEKQ